MLLWESFPLYIPHIDCDQAAKAIPLEVFPRGGSPLLVEIEGVDAAVRRDSARQRGGERAAARAGLKHDAPRDELEVGDDETDVGDVEDLGPVAEHERPELRGRRQEVHESTAGLATTAPLAPSTPASAAGGAEDLGSEGEADPVVVAEDAEPQCPSGSPGTTSGGATSSDAVLAGP